MMTPDFTIGIEEEYLLVDPETGALAEMPPALLEECTAARPGQISPEYLKCQIEVGTGVCRTVAEAREDLGNLRRTVREAAHRHGLAPIAVSCHPFADWKDQHHTDKSRYNQLRSDLGGVARRMLICGMHVHVGLGDDDLRADLMGQFSYFLPHLLALSASSPFWQGDDTGLASYRLTVFDNLPRTGLPPQFGSWSEFQRSVDMLIGAGIIEDSSKIWWDLRPSARFPTLETRICDVSPHIEATLSIAALIQSLMRMLWRLRRQNQRWRRYDNFLIAENRWRAQRYGTTGTLIDFGRQRMVPYSELLDEMIDLVREDAEALGCLSDVEAARNILRTGTSAERQRSVAAEAAARGEGHGDRMKAVVAALIGEFSDGL